VNPISVPAALITTDVWGRIRDGKPRLRRTNPNDHSILNVAPLIAALALLPDPIREDKGALVLPLRDKGYVIRTITFSVEIDTNNNAICTPHRLKVLHDNNEIDLTARLLNVAALLANPSLPQHIRDAADEYIAIVRSGAPQVRLRDLATSLANWFTEQPELSEALEAPSEAFIEHPHADGAEVVTLADMTADETKRRLVSHYRIDRSGPIRTAKVKAFKHQHGNVYCENCAFDFEEKYGERGKGFIEVHHTQQLAALLPNVVTRLTDLMLLCSNCHRMIHRKQPLLTPEALREITTGL
jgi:5-methylcytosine-specific restriction protein A